MFVAATEQQKAIVDTTANDLVATRGLVGAIAYQERATSGKDTYEFGELVLQRLYEISMPTE